VAQIIREVRFQPVLPSKLSQKGSFYLISNSRLSQLHRLPRLRYLQQLQQLSQQRLPQVYQLPQLQLATLCRGLNCWDGTLEIKVRPGELCLGYNRLETET